MEQDEQEKLFLQMQQQDLDQTEESHSWFVNSDEWERRSEEVLLTYSQMMEELGRAYDAISTYFWNYFFRNAFKF